jgi:hypothetical protein
MDEYFGGADELRYHPPRAAREEQQNPWGWVFAIVLMVVGVIVLHSQQDRVMLELSHVFPSLKAKLPPEMQLAAEGGALAPGAPQAGGATTSEKMSSQNGEHAGAAEEADDERPEIKIGRLLKRSPRAPRVAVMLRWTKVKGAQSYHVQVSRNRAFDANVVDAEVGQTRLFKKRLLPGSYFCRTRAKTETDYGPFSEVVRVPSELGESSSSGRRRGKAKSRARPGKRRRSRTHLAAR